MVPIRPDRLVSPLSVALDDPRVVERYRALVSPLTTASGCSPWLGAISAQGSGRFWLGGGHVTIAHRFGFALAFGISALLEHPQVAHQCDEASCQTPEHMLATSGSRNTLDWIARRDTIGNPLRDTRGARGRALALRRAARAGLDLDAAALEGLPENDRYQPALFDPQPSRATPIT